MAHPNRSLQGRTNETEIAETVATTLENPHTSLLIKQDWSVAVGLAIMSERELNRIEVLSQVT
jgi:hypothetical protein